MAPKIDTSSASGSVQKLRKTRGSTQPGRYEVLRVAHGNIKAHREAKNATRRARQIRTSSSDSDSDTTSSSIAPVIDEKHEKHAKKSSVIWQHMSQKEVDGKKQTICNYCGLSWFLGGSTSNALRHLKINHPEKLTECNAPTTEASGGNPKKMQYKASTAATADPALANFALIMANNNATEYVKILKELYKDNGLQAPDFSKYLS